MAQNFLAPLPISQTFEISRDLFCHCGSVNVGSMREGNVFTAVYRGGGGGLYPMMHKDRLGTVANPGPLTRIFLPKFVVKQSYADKATQYRLGILFRNPDGEQHLCRKTSVLSWFVFAEFKIPHTCSLPVLILHLCKTQSLWVRRGEGELHLNLIR